MSVSLDIQKQQDSVPSAHYDVVVVGAGPYGLSTSAHLLGKGLKVATFGKPIHLWREHMPQGMLLRSYWWATQLSDPKGEYSFERYYQAKGIVAKDPVPIETFIDYGLWFQKHAVPDVDETYVKSIERKDDEYLVRLEDGRVVQSSVIVMAPGLYYYINRPAQYAHMPSELVSHSADHYDLSKFADQRVAVIGGGQGALELAALLNEAGATVHVASRSRVHWLSSGNKKLPNFIRQLRAPKAGMGSGWLNLLLEKYPYIYQQLPRDTRDYVLDTRHGPAGSSWLKPRVEGKVSLYEQTQVEKIEEEQGHAKLTFSNGKVLEVDHVMLGTGFRPDVKRLPMLSSSLADAIQTYQGSPILNPWFESSVRGVYFVGFSSARSFGPYYRFVVGNDAAARRVAGAVARRVAHAG